MPDAAERLRTAAARMRALAEAVDTSEARGGADNSIVFTWAEQIKFLLAGPDGAHLSTFGHPAVALAVADLLLTVAAEYEHGEHSEAWEPIEQALAVADAFLGATP